MGNSLLKYLTFILICLSIFVHSNVNAQREVVISTDCAVDDLRAICELLAVKEIEVKAIVSSDGMLHPKEGRVKILELLNQLNIKNILVGEGVQIHKDTSLHSKFLMSVKWGETLQNDKKSVPADEIIKTVTENSKNLLTIICLGPLTDISAFVKKYPELKKKIKKIIWYNESMQPLSGTNYEFDKEASNYLANSTIPINVVSNLHYKNAVLSIDYFNDLDNINNPYSKIISESHKNEKIVSAINSGYFQLWDDLLPVYCLYPNLFDMEPLINNPTVTITKNYKIEAVKEKIFQILAQTYSLENNIVFDKFPSDSIAFNYDVREIMHTVINKYGNDEWRVCVLTNEIHGHLGTYSIIGAKMGMYARDILKAEIDRIQITSFAGSIPPLSCMNDGLQISTGATLGLGMIEVINDSVPLPAAIFTYKEKKIKLTLKKEVYEQIQKDINDGIVKFGNLTQGYWKLIRVMSLKQWKELDRNKIFEMQEL
ncbi:MAG: nucleoside hydrolase [Bacteroidales bacterium]|jgi:pyrimidine-specific ribonucleoside hydrolase|nr:nucleoside hydrolase [Bacteroidales bacterium]